MENQISSFFHPRWPVFYQDNHLLALYKPAGLLMQGDRTNDITLIALAKQWIKQRYEKPGDVYLGLVHRLDRPVAGVVLFCRTSKAASRISEQFRTGKTKKKYIAVLEGVLKEKSGLLVNQLERHRILARIPDAPTEKSREARLSYTVIDVRDSKTLVEIDLETGKHHQIRLQFSHIGYPVMGDLRYGASAPMPIKQIALFAKELTIIHPIHQTLLTFQSPFPENWPWPDMHPTDAAPLWTWQEIYPQLPADLL